MARGRAAAQATPAAAKRPPSAAVRRAITRRRAPGGMQTPSETAAATAAAPMRSPRSASMKRVVTRGSAPGKGTRPETAVAARKQRPAWRVGCHHRSLTQSRRRCRACRCVGSAHSIPTGVSLCKKWTLRSNCYVMTLSLSVDNMHYGHLNI